ncbi:hypothetical protein B0J13DRAFT_30465 [Dactylonectria estremocensis]|uniref:Zn(2)-C6 fungal-type domain-containing protein n=1 Tax=Dactylonectria estremocensis TaxID=1079267 RepID=A0A9P9FJ08_9HYPO|nr:hypothetical protein B0J13DRAFT_30465 [Dactylonectria estremocensis]
MTLDVLIYQSAPVPQWNTPPPSPHSLFFCVQNISLEVLGTQRRSILRSTEPMTSIMSSYQYPLPPVSTAADMSQPAYAPTYHTLPQQPSSIGPYYASGARQLQPANPELHPQHTQFGTLADKKKNKLGYHRTTVACGNCRRRKIRCAPGPIDAQNRCANCVRMKKDCIFYPVDQPPPPTELQVELAQLTSSTGPKGTDSLSPVTSSGNLTRHSKIQPSGPIPQHIRTVLPSTFKSGNVEVHPPEAKATLGSSTSKALDYGGQPVTNWIHPDLSQSPISNTADMNQTWRGYPPESPMTAQFSPFGPSTPSATWAPGDSDPDSRGDMPWGHYPPPGRSMSYGGEPPIQYPPGPQGRQFDRRASMFPDVYTPSMAMPMSGMETSGGLGMDPLGQLPAGAAPTQAFGAWNQAQSPQHSGYSYSAWGFSGPGQPMQAEPGQHHPDNEPPPDVYYPPG